MLFILNDSKKICFTIFNNETKKNLVVFFSKELTKKFPNLKARKNFFEAPINFNMLDVIHLFYADFEPAYEYKIKTIVKSLNGIKWIKDEVFIKINKKEEYRKFTLKEMNKYAPTGAKKFNSFTEKV